MRGIVFLITPLCLQVLDRGGFNVMGAHRNGGQKLACLASSDGKVGNDRQFLNGLEYSLNMRIRKL
jgi:hypothetical protein